MPFHLAAYRNAALANVANTDISAVTDDILAIANNHFLPQQDYDMIFAYAGSATLSRARINSPTNRQITVPFIRPINQAVIPANNYNFADYTDRPFRVKALEELAVEATSAVAMTEVFFALVALQTNFQPVPQGNVFTMRGTSVTAATSGAWSTLAVTWADNLPQYQYIVTGLEVQSTNAVAARIIFEQQVERPGTISITSLANRQPYGVYKGSLGVFGRFVTTRMPIIQVLCNGADAAHEIYMEIMRVG